MTLKRPWLMQASGGDALLTYSGLDTRALFDAIYLTEGIAGPQTSLVVTQRAAGADFTVDIAAGFAMISGDDVSNQGKYMCQSTAVENRTIPAPPVSGTRTHRIIARVMDKTHNGAWSDYEWDIEVLEDTSGVTPDEPDSAITLALIPVTSATTSITTGIIDDQRPVASLAGSGRLPSVPTKTDLPPSGTLFDSYGIDDLAPIRVVWDGSSWCMDASAAQLYVERTSDLPRATTSLSNDSQLVAILLTGVVYKIEGVLFYTASSSTDFKYQFNVPAGGSLNATARNLPAAATGSSGDTTQDRIVEGASYIGGGSGATVMTVEVEGKVWSGSGGQLALQWAANAAGTANLLQNSYLELMPKQI